MYVGGGGWCVFICSVFLSVLLFVSVLFGFILFCSV